MLAVAKVPRAFILCMRKRIGLYGGTFDPFHFGHLSFAISVKERLLLDQVWMIPTGQNPFKKDVVASFADRFAMCQEAVNSVPGFSVLDIEGQERKFYYTVDTVEKLRKEYPKEEFFLLLGEDAAKGFGNWHRVEDLLEQVLPVVGIREHEGEWTNDEKVDFALQKGRLQTPRFDISATEIRDRMRNHLYVGHLVPHRTLQYIVEKKLYGMDTVEKSN